LSINFRKSGPGAATTSTPVFTFLPPAWMPCAATLDFAAQKGLDHAEIERELQIFADHCAARARRSADWEAEFRTWIGRLERWQQADITRGNRRQPVDIFAAMRRVRLPGEDLATAWR
jgi:hypothetical protein